MSKGVVMRCRALLSWTREVGMKMTSGRLLALAALLAMAVLFHTAIGCSGSDRKTMGEAFFTYSETDLVDFNVSGEAKCGSCEGNNIAGLYVELVSDLSPTTYLSVDTFEGLGPFFFSNLRAVAESGAVAYGTLFFDDRPESQALKAQASFKVPDGDDETVAITLNFGQ